MIRSLIDQHPSLFATSPLVGVRAMLDLVRMLRPQDFRKTAAVASVIRPDLPSAVVEALWAEKKEYVDAEGAAGGNSGGAFVPKAGAAQPAPAALAADDITVPHLLLECAGRMAAFSGLPPFELNALLCMVEQCQNPSLLTELLQLVLWLGTHVPKRLYGFLRTQLGENRVLLQLLSSEREVVRLAALKILGRVLHDR